MNKQSRKKTAKLLVLVEKLKELQNYDDGERAHIDADELLLDFIADDNVREAYKKITRWYA